MLLVTTPQAPLILLLRESKPQLNLLRCNKPHV